MTSTTADSTETTISSPAPPRRSLKRRIVVAVVVLVLGGVAYGGWWVWTLNAGLDRARLHVRRGEWQAARQQLDRYLRLHPENAEAHFLMAEAFFKDESGSDGNHVELAIQHLQQVGPESPLAAKARLQEARLRLLILHQPSRAEALLRESLRLDGNSYDANLLMWKLADLTGRHYLSRPYFWKVFELSPERDKPFQLREWFLSEFFPDSANSEFDRAMEVQETAKLPRVVVRFLRFRKNEPESPANHAILAWYFLDSKDPATAVKLLKMAPDLDAAMKDSLYVSVLFESLLELGEFDKAANAFEKWPPPHDTYDYRRCRGLLEQLIRKDFRAAAAAFEKALNSPRGRLDWPLMSRLADCLAKSGRMDDAARLRTRIDRLTKTVLTPQNTKSLRKALADLQDPAAVEQAREFYAGLGLQEESRAWGEYRQRLTAGSRTQFRP